MRKDRFTDEALAQAEALAELKYSENPEDQLAFSEAYDFARCQRADGSFYGIPDGKQCKKGKKASPAEPKSAPKSKKKGGAAERMAAAYERGVKSGRIKVSKPRIGEKKLYRLAEKRAEMLERLERERRMLKRMSKAKKAEPMRRAREEKIAKLKRSYDRLNELYIAASRRLDDGARAGKPRPLIPSNYDTPPKRGRAASGPAARKPKLDFRKEIEEGAARRKKRDAEIADNQKRVARGRKFLQRARSGMKRLEAQYKVAQGRLQMGRADRIMDAIARLRKQADKIAADVEKRSPGARDRGELYVG